MKKEKKKKKGLKKEKGGSMHEARLDYDSFLLPLFYFLLLFVSL